MDPTARDPLEPLLGDPLEPLLGVRRIILEMLQDCERYTLLISRFTTRKCLKTEGPPALVPHPHPSIPSQ